MEEDSLKNCERSTIKATLTTVSNVTYPISFSFNTSRAVHHVMLLERQETVDTELMMPKPREDRKNVLVAFTKEQ
jgi:hypothetical protein